MGDKVSQVISYVFHPLLISTYTFGLLYYMVPHLIMPLSVMSLPFLFISTFVIPSISLGVLRASGSISSLKMMNREERLTPFVFISLFFVMTSYMFIFKIGVNSLVATIFVSTTVLILLLTLITIIFKISIHAAAMSGLFGFVLSVMLKVPELSLLYPMLVVLVLTGAVMSARLQLQAHTTKEILAGGLLGFIISFFSLYWFV
ncbi:MAG: PA-phosphatase [Reichenbachiella sp.]